MNKLIIFDGNSILNRAFYGIRSLTTGDGFPTNAIYGFISIILKNMHLCDGADMGAVAFDMRAPTFRHKMYEHYKENRHGMPEELAMQLPCAKEAAALMGFTVLEKEGYEADDILGTLARMATEAGVECVIVTGDRDSLQLVNDSTKVFLAATNETKIFDRAAFVEKYGVQPEVFVDVKALMGDTSDCIPGVKGIGEKGALKLISEYGSLDGVYAAADGIKGSIGEKLRADKENAYLSQTLATINREVPVEVSLEDLKIERNDSELYDFCTRFELKGLAERLQLQKETGTEQSAEPFEEADGKSAAKLFEGSKKIYVLCENEALYITDGEKKCKVALQNAAGLFDGINASVSYWSYKETVEQTESYGIQLPQAVEDISLLAYVVKPSEGGKQTPIRTAKALGLYDGEDSTDKGAELLPELEEKLKEEAAIGGQMRLYGIEKKLSTVLLDMQHLGFKVDRQGLEEYSAVLAGLMLEAETRIYELAGEEFNINSPKQLSVILFDKLGLPHSRKTQSGYSTDADVMEKLRKKHPIVDLILSYRQFSKLKSTYADGLCKVISEKDGRIHSTFKQTLTMTGRLSSTEPNLQNIPVRTELGRIFRKFFVPEEGYVLVDADYSQIELRILAHMSGDATLIEAFHSGDDIHAITASQVFNLPMFAVTEELRKRAKAVNFGIVYGMSAFSLAEDIGVSRREAQDYINAYFAKYPAVRDYLDETVKKAKQDGYVSTMFGRRRYVPELKSRNRNVVAFGERVAMNTPIQGTAADIIKKAMVDTATALQEAGMRARIVLQVHDELIVEAPLDEAEAAKQLLKEKMECTAKLLVPLVADAHIGKTWLSAK